MPYDFRQQLTQPNRAGKPASLFAILGVNPLLPTAQLEAAIKKRYETLYDEYGHDDIDDTLEEALQAIRDRLQPQIHEAGRELAELRALDNREQECLELEERERELRAQLEHELEVEEQRIKQYAVSIENAYETLSDPETRAEYQKLYKDKKSDMSTNGSQLFFNMGWQIVTMEKSQISQLFEPTETQDIFTSLRQEFLVLCPDRISPKTTPYWEDVDRALVTVESSVEAALQELGRELQNQQLNLTTFAHAGARIIDRHQSMTGDLFQRETTRILENVRDKHLQGKVTADQLQRVEEAIAQGRHKLNTRFTTMRKNLVARQSLVIQRAFERCPEVAAQVRAALEQYRNPKIGSGEFTLANGHVKCLMEPRADQKRTVTRTVSHKDEYNQWSEPYDVEDDMIYINVLHNEKNDDGKTPTEEEILDSFLVSMLTLKEEGCDVVHITSSDPDMRNLAMIAAQMAGFDFDKGQIVNHSWQADHSRYQWSGQSGWDYYKSTGHVKVVQSDPLSDDMQARIQQAAQAKWESMGKKAAANVQQEIEKRQPEPESREEDDLTASTTP